MGEPIDKITIEEFFDRPIAYYPGFTPFVGVTGAIMLSQALYWSRRTTGEDGWFYKTRDEWWLETGLKRYEQETARKRLKKYKLIEEKRKGTPAKLFFRVNYETIGKHIEVLKKNGMSYK